MSPQALDEHIRAFLLKHVARSGEIRVVFMGRDAELPREFAAHILSAGQRHQGDGEQPAGDRCSALDETSPNWNDTLQVGRSSADGAVLFQGAGDHACRLDPKVLDSPEASLDALGEELRLVASVSQMESALGLPGDADKYMQTQRDILQRVALDRDVGTLQPELCREFGIKPQNIFHVMKQLELSHLISRVLDKAVGPGSAGKNAKKNKNCGQQVRLRLYAYRDKGGTMDQQRLANEQASVTVLAKLKEATDLTPNP